MQAGELGSAHRYEDRWKIRPIDCTVAVHTRLTSCTCLRNPNRPLFRAFSKIVAMHRAICGTLSVTWIRSLASVPESNDGNRVSASLRAKGQGVGKPRHSGLSRENRAGAHTAAKGLAPPLRRWLPAPPELVGSGSGSSASGRWRCTGCRGQ